MTQFVSQTSLSPVVVAVLMFVQKVSPSPPSLLNFSLLFGQFLASVVFGQTDRKRKSLSLE